MIESRSDGFDGDGRSYGDRLKLAMERAGLSRSALAQLLSLSYNAIRDAETGAFRPWNSERAAAHLGVAHHWLALGDGAMSPDGVDLQAAFSHLRHTLTAAPAVARERFSQALGRLAAAPDSDIVFGEVVALLGDLERADATSTDLPTMLSARALDLARTLDSISDPALHRAAHSAATLAISSLLASRDGQNATPGQAGPPVAAPSPHARKPR